MAKNIAVVEGIGTAHETCAKRVSTEVDEVLPEKRCGKTFAELESMSQMERWCTALERYTTDKFCRYMPLLAYGNFTVEELWEYLGIAENHVGNDIDGRNMLFWYSFLGGQNDLKETIKHYFISSEDVPELTLGMAWMYEVECQRCWERARAWAGDEEGDDLFCDDDGRPVGYWEYFSWQFDDFYRAGQVYERIIEGKRVGYTKEEILSMDIDALWYILYRYGLSDIAPSTPEEAWELLENADFPERESVAYCRLSLPMVFEMQKNEPIEWNELIEWLGKKDIKCNPHWYDVWEALKFLAREFYLKNNKF